MMCKKGREEKRKKIKRKLSKRRKGRSEINGRMPKVPFILSPAM
jgi:hypothetical protein